MNRRNPTNSITSTILNPLFIALCFLLLTGCAAYIVQPPQEDLFHEKIAMLTFDNLSDNKEALTYVMQALRQRLEKKGLEIVEQEKINSFVCKERVRTTGYVSHDLAGKIKEEFGVETILVGSVISFSTGENPKIALSARLIDSTDGSIRWADYASATGEDFGGIFDLGKLKTVYSLLPRVAERLLASFSIESPAKEIESTYRIAVMPFQNKSKTNDAGMMTTYMFLTELSKSRGFEPVEFGDIRKLIVDSRIRYRGALDFKNIQTLSKSLRIDMILVGTVERYSDGLQTLSPPEAAITARLLDARANRILWYNSQQLNGEDKIIVFDWGRIRTVDKVAHRIVSNLAEEMWKAKWH